MRPVTVDPNPPYAIPVTMNTRTAAIKKGLARHNVQPVKTDTYNTAQVLALAKYLTGQNGGTAKWGSLGSVDKAFMAGLINYLTENKTMRYGNARGALIDNYGQYCSYCGTPVQDTALAIEHCLPKSEFPSEMLYYANFFLCCPSCNSNKGSKPTWAMGLAWAQKTIPIPNLDQIMAGGMDRQYWPNSGNAFTGFNPMLFDHTNDDDIDILYSSQLDNILVGVTQNTVQARIANYHGGNIITVASQLDRNDGGTAGEMEDNFIDIIKLNAYEPNVYSDRRVTNRTVTWLNILASVKNLNMFPAGGDPWKIMLKQIFSTAKSAGFYEIWASLFYIISPPSVGANSVYVWFKTISTNSGEPAYYFPGTNAAALPS